MNYDNLTDEELAAALSKVSDFNRDEALRAVEKLGHDWAVFRLETRSGDAEAKERVERNIKGFRRSLAR